MTKGKQFMVENPCGVCRSQQQQEPAKTRSNENVGKIDWKQPQNSLYHHCNAN